MIKEATVERQDILSAAHIDIIRVMNHYSGLGLDPQEMLSIMAVVFNTAVLEVVEATSKGPENDQPTFDEIHADYQRIFAKHFAAELERLRTVHRAIESQTVVVRSTGAVN